ncbi:hypothetical protein PV327_002115 [Microctonus hyperodae]|uniref:Uncharacterized protein n=1 Tax=Microctonus hyperodae TaxID=165561 RepID=A0AA39FF29_MICHY|nr:hypothetical protein PV327_002115 [Microctonus hyperodae]
MKSFRQDTDNALTTAEEVNDGVQAHDNDTDSLQSLSHLDPPVDGVYMICGVLIAMVLVGVIIVLLAVTISKLRKREDNANDEVHHHHHHHHHHQNNLEQSSVTQTSPNSINNNNVITTTNNTGQTMMTMSQDIRNNGIVNPAMSINNLEINGINDGNTTFVTETNADQFVWQFPPPYPPPITPPPQYTLYNDQNALVHGMQADRAGFAKGFRKNLGGRWRRLVKRKSNADTCAIPPELKDQLKTIYVY